MNALKMPFTAGLPETHCGAGSTLAHTEFIRAALPELMRKIGVRTLLDAPCGDFNWMACTDLSDVDYIGCDYDAAHCRAAMVRQSSPGYMPRSKKVMLLDLCSDRLPSADLMLCRDFLQHLPFASVATVLRNVIDSRIDWFLGTSHFAVKNDDIEEVGMFRPLSLTEAPFNLPPPRQAIADGTRILGLWHRNEIKC